MYHQIPVSNWLFQNKRGLVLVRTASLVIVATYNEHMYPSVCVEAVEKLGKVKMAVSLAFKVENSQSSGCS